MRKPLNMVEVISTVRCFVSNLTTDTKSADVVSFLHKKHNRCFKVVQIPSKFNDSVSFKVVVPVELKDYYA